MWLFDSSIVSWRELVNLVLLSLCFAGASRWLFANNAPGQRAFAVVAGVLLLLCPWLWASVSFTIPVALATPPNLSLAQPLSLGLVGLLLSVSLVGLLRVTYGALLDRRALRSLLPLQDGRLQTIGEPLCASLGLHQPPQYLVLNQSHSRLPQAPFASTLFGARVVLPSHYHAWDDATLRATLVHELIHVSRRDDGWRLLLRAMVSLYWFLPWLRGLEQRYLVAMEHSCDDRAADFFGPSWRYLEGVVAAAQLAPGVPASQPPALTPSEAVPPPSAHPFIQRVLRFGRRRYFAADTACVLGCAGLVTGFALVLSSLHFVALPPPALTYASAGLSLPPPVRAPLFDMPSTMPSVVPGSVTIVGSTAGAASVPTLVPTFQPAAVYPGRALRQLQQADVLVEYTVALDGSVVNPVVLAGDRAGLFSASALRAVKQTRFASQPQRRGLTPVNLTFSRSNASQLRVRQRFRYQIAASN